MFYFSYSGGASQSQCYQTSRWYSPSNCSLEAEECNLKRGKPYMEGDLKQGTNWIKGRCARYSLWDPYGELCSGKALRSICNFGVEDLPRAKASKCLLGNKFNFDVSPAAVLCQVVDLMKQNNESGS